MNQTLPLQGLTVVTIEQALAAPLCSSRLAEAGARVIKIERAQGDFARGYDSAVKGESSYFTWTNQGKESVVLDFKKATDAQCLSCLLSQADIFIQNLAPGALQRSGFGSEALREKHPKLITCDISGYSPSTQTSHLKAYDLLIQAESGLLDVSGGVNEIGRIGVSICDIGAGMTAHAAILEALLLRHKTGKGSGVQVSLFDVVADWMSVPLMHYDYAGKAPKRVGLHHPSIAPYGAYPVKDNQLIIIGIQNEAEWQRFCKGVLKQPELSSDERFHSNNQRVANRVLLDDAIQTGTLQLQKSELIARLIKHKIAFGSVSSVAELSEHPGLRRRKVGLTEGVQVSIPARPIVNTAFQPISGRSPKLGEHTSNINNV